MKNLQRVEDSERPMTEGCAEHDAPDAQEHRAAWMDDPEAGDRLVKYILILAE